MHTVRLSIPAFRIPPLQGVSSVQVAPTCDHECIGGHRRFLSVRRAILACRGMCWISQPCPMCARMCELSNHCNIVQSRSSSSLAEFHRCTSQPVQSFCRSTVIMQSNHVSCRLVLRNSFIVCWSEESSCQHVSFNTCHVARLWPTSERLKQQPQSQIASNYSARPKF